MRKHRAIILIVAIFIPFSSIFLSAPASAVGLDLEIDAKQGWQATGLRLVADQQVTIKVASGLWTHWVGNFPPNPGSGENYICTDFQPPHQCNEPLPSFRKGALIARVGSQILGIGNQNTVTFSGSGELELRINDDDNGLLDNEGNLTTEILMPLTIEVDSRQGWQGTGIQIPSNQSTTIEAVNGLWTHWLGTVPYNNGDGEGYICTNHVSTEQCVEPLPGFRKGALIARIGNQLFGIGNQTTIAPPEAGLLELRINDADGDALNDNDGRLSVNIRIGPIVETIEALNHLKVFVVSFPFSSEVSQAPSLTAQLIAHLKEASRYHGYKDVSSQPYFEFEIYGGTVIEDPQVPPQLPNGYYDYASIYQKYDLCRLILSREVDEVWFWDAGQGGFEEWVSNGPRYPIAFSTNVPNCGRQVATMTYNYTRDVSLALHSFGHRLEGYFAETFPCEYNTETWPISTWPSRCAGQVSDRYGFIARAFPGNDNIAACGDIHHPPNIVQSYNKDYDYSNQTIVLSICEDWQQDGTATAKSINCEVWQCDAAKYYIWWMQNVPGINNSNRNRFGEFQPNWWSIVFDIQSHKIFLPKVIR